jgi:hypothetical protein
MAGKASSRISSRLEEVAVPSPRKGDLGYNTKFLSARLMDNAWGGGGRELVLCYARK